MLEDDPWSRPSGSEIPNRPGDREPEGIYLELGRAISAWEGVNAATATLFYAMSKEEDRLNPDTNAVEAFGGLNNIHCRAKRLKEYHEHFFNAEFGAFNDKAKEIFRSFSHLMAAYRGWAQRRNDLAHGYVTKAESPDYAHESQPLIALYALCPSHARRGHWPRSEPIFNYVANDIALFAEAFSKLDLRVEEYAEHIERLRVSRTAR